MTRNDETVLMRQESGSVHGHGKLLIFIYCLLRDHLPCGKVEEIIDKANGPTAGTVFTNGWLANYSKYIRKRLLKDNHRVDICSFCGQKPTETKWFVAGKTGAICDVCLESCRKKMTKKIK